MLQVTFQPVSNRADWIDQIEVRDQNDQLVNLTGATITIGVRDPKTKAALLNSKTGDGTLVLQGTGVFQFTFSASKMRGLDASKQYEVGCTILLSGVTQQFFIGTVGVLDGIVP